MEKKLNEIVQKLFGSDKFPTRLLIIYLLLTALYALLSVPIGQRVMELSMKNAEANPAANEFMSGILGHMDVITVVSSLIGALVGVLFLALVIWGLSKLILPQFSYSKSVLMALVMSFIEMISDYLSLGINYIVGVENIMSANEVNRVSLGNLLHFLGVSEPGALLSVIDPFYLLAFCALGYCWYVLSERKAKGIYIAVALYCVYVLFQALMLNMAK